MNKSKNKCKVTKILRSFCLIYLFVFYLDQEDTAVRQNISTSFVAGMFWQRIFIKHTHTCPPFVFLLLIHMSIAWISIMLVYTYTKYSETSIETPCLMFSWNLHFIFSCKCKGNYAKTSSKSLSLYIHAFYLVFSRCMLICIIIYLINYRL